MLKDRIKEAIIPAFITLAVFMGVLFAKGIFPFGGLRIDYYDMGQTNAPLYYHIWDFLHGKGGLFYSWYIDEGQNLSMGSSIQWNISVFNLFFLFIKRSAVMKSLSVFMGLHLFFMAFNMDLFLRHTIDTPRFYRILFSIAYGLTGFTLTHYTIPTYLDTAALMPLYLITLYDVLADDKRDRGSASGAGRPGTAGIAERFKVYINPTALYALMTGYMTASGYYMAFMNLIFVLLVSGTYIFILCGTGAANSSGCPESLSRKSAQTADTMPDKASRRLAAGRAATRLGAGTFGGIGLSSFILLPAAMQMMKSSRFNSNLSGGLFDTLHDILWAIGADMYYIKWWLLSGSVAAIVIILAGLVCFRKEKRQTLFIVLFCMYPCALIVFESINLLWHMGTYYHYPIRCGYLIPIVLLTAAAYYTGRFERNYVNQKESVNGEITEKYSTLVLSYVNYNPIVLAIVDAVAVASGIGLIFYYLRHDVWNIEELFRAWVIFALILAAVYFIIFFVIRRPACIMPVLLMELAVTAYVGYGQPHFVDRFSSDPEQSGDYVVTSQLLADGLGIEESRTERIKDPDTTLNTNYGFVMRRATVGGWANTVPRPQMDTAIALGYGAHFMRILDCGGSLLSDAALHVTQTVTMRPELYSEEAWVKKGEVAGYTLFDNKYTLPFVMKIPDSGVLASAGGSGLKDMGFADATNALYECLSSGAGSHDDGGSEEKSMGKDTGDTDTGKEIVKDITGDIRAGKYYVNQKKALYLRDGSFDELKINGNVIPVPDIGDPYGVSYPAWFNSGVLFLGIYEDEEITLEGADDPDIRFYELDIDRLAALCEALHTEASETGQEISTGRSSLDITLEGKAGQIALVPMAYDTGFAASVNGVRTEVMNASDMFMGIPLTDGTNRIRLSFTPDGLIPGIILSIVFLALTVILSLRPAGSAHIDKVSPVILAILWTVFLTVLYLIPYIAFVIHQIEKRI